MILYSMEELPIELTVGRFLVTFLFLNEAFFFVSNEFYYIFSLTGW